MELVEEHLDFRDLRRRNSWFGGAECSSRCCVPHPSFGILKFWQGRLEIILRLLSAGFAGIILLPALWILLELKIPDTGEESVDTSQSESHKVLMWVIIAAGLGLLTQLLIVTGRFLNLEFAIAYNSLIRIMDIVAGVIFASSYFTLCIPLFVFSEDLLQLEGTFPERDFTTYFPALRKNYLATACLCCLAFIQYLLLSIWMSVFLSFRWDKKLKRYLQPSRNTPIPTEPEDI